MTTGETGEALRDLMELIENGDLVRNMSEDHNGMFFMKQGLRIALALRKAQRALEGHKRMGLKQSKGNKK